MNRLATEVFLGAYKEDAKQDASLVQKLRLRPSHTGSGRAG